MNRRIVALSVVGVLVAAFGVFPAAAAPERPEIQVLIHDDEVHPRKLVVTHGEVGIVWRNETDLPRSITVPNFGVFGSEVLMPGEEYRYVPRVAGVFRYVVDTYPMLLPDLRLHGVVKVAPTRGDFVYEKMRLKLIWGPRAVPPGLAFDVQRAASDFSQMTLVWRWWKRAVRAGSAWMHIRCDGSERIRVRVRNVESGARSGWSPAGGSICIVSRAPA